MKPTYNKPFPQLALLARKGLQAAWAFTIRRSHGGLYSRLAQGLLNLKDALDAGQIDLRLPKLGARVKGYSFTVDKVEVSNV